MTTESSTVKLWPVKMVFLLTTAANAPLLRFIVVFYESCGLSTSQIGNLQVMSMIATLVGSMFWSAQCDRTGRYKDILSACYVIAVLLLTCMYLLRSYAIVIFILAPLSFFFRSVETGVFDAVALKLLQQGSQEQGYGQQRLFASIGWGVMSLITGHMLDATGNMAFMFYCYAGMITIMVLILRTQIEFPEANTNTNDEDAEPRLWNNLGVFCTPRHMFFLLNLLVYGTAMIMVETFLFVYLLVDFHPAASDTLLGMTVAVMCLFELPVFYYSEDILSRFGTTRIQSFCQAVLALRCILYCLIPSKYVFLVLLIEPLHGFTFAAMWIASVDYAKRHAPPGLETVSQALVGSTYRTCGGIVGNMMWGYIIPRYGFGSTYLLDSLILAVWGIIWFLVNRETISTRRSSKVNPKSTSSPEAEGYYRISD